MPKLSERKKQMVEKMMRDALYEATSSVIAEHGWPGLTMDRVAEEAGVSKGTVYNYFKDKKELVWFVITSLALDVEERVSNIITSQESCAEALSELIRKELRGRRKHGHLATAFIHAFHDEPELREKMLSSNHPFYRVDRMIEDLFARGVEKGEFREMDPKAMQAVFNSILMGVSRRWAGGQLDIATDEMSDFINSLLTEGIIRKDNK